MNTGELSIQKERNLGVDLLRCAAMWMITCLHILNHGGALAASRNGGYYLLLGLNSFVSCGVNVYALISGYVTVEGRFHPARVAGLWLQVFFMNMVIALFGEIIRPHSMDGFWIRYIFPLTQKCFWYFTAYVGVYAFSPLINRGIRALNARQCKAMVWCMLLLFSLGTFLGYLNQGDPWGIGAGYNVLWLLVLYVIGACIRRSDFGKNTAGWKLIALILLLVFAATLLRIVIKNSTDQTSFLSKLRGQLLYYVSPFEAGISVCLLLLFSRLRVGGLAAKLAGFFGPLTFGVYIIHVHHVIWTRMQARFSPLGKLRAVPAFLAVIGAGLGLFLVCALLDWLRSLLFRRLGVKPRLDRLEKRFMSWLQNNPKETP